MVIGCVIICAFIGSSVAYDNKKEYETTWGNQDFTVPEKITEIVVLLQGAGGGGGESQQNGAQGRHNGDSTGGGGGLTIGTLKVTPGEKLSIIVGEGGRNGPQSGNAFGGGGKVDSGYWVGAGGGRSAIRRDWNELATAGGGGGGGYGNDHHGGGGGGDYGMQGGGDATPGTPYQVGHCCGTSDSFDGQHTGKFNNCHGAGSGGGGWFGGGAGNCDQPGAGGSGTTRGLFENKHTSSAGSSGSSNYGGLGGQAMFEGTQYNNDGQTGRGGDPGHGGSNGKVTIFWNNVVTTTTTTPTVVVTTTKLTTTTTTTFTTVKDETYCTAGEFLYQQFFAGFTIDPYCTACRTGKFIQEKSHQLDKCKSFSTCGSDSYKVTAGTKTSDTECKKLVVCTQGSQYETLAPKTGYGSSEYTSDRECEDVTPCRGDEYVQMTATKDKDQQCTKCDGTAAAIRGGCEQTTKRTTTRRTTRKPDTTQWQPDDDDDYYERRTTRRRTTVPAVIVTATTTTATITTATTTTTIPVSTLSADDYTAAGVELLDAIDMIERELSIATGSPMVEHLLDIGYSSTDIYALQFFDDDELLDGGFNSITLLQAERAYAEATEKGNGGTVAAVIIVVILLVGGFAYFVYRRKQSMEEESGGVVEWKEAAYITSCMTWLSELCEGCGGGGGSSSEMSGFTERDVQKHRSSTRSRSGSINTGGKATALTDKCGWKSAASGQTCAVQTSNIHCPRHTCTKPKCMNGKESSQPFCSEHMAEETIVVNPLAGNDDADEEYGTMAHVAIDAPEIDEDEYGPSVGIANDVNVENFGGFEGGDGDDDSLYEVQNDEEI